MVKITRSSEEVGYRRSNTIITRFWGDFGVSIFVISHEVRSQPNLSPSKYHTYFNSSPILLAETFMPSMEAIAIPFKLHPVSYLCLCM